ncbi:MAG: ATP-binding protein [Pedobacter sp.]
MNIKSAHIVLLLLLSGFFGTIYYQYHKASEIHDAQETAMNMQSLLESSDLFSSNLGSMQQYFRNYVANPTSVLATNIEFHSTIVDSALIKMKRIGDAGSDLKSLTATMGSIYYKERDIIQSYISRSENVERADKNTVEASEAHMDLVWSSLFEYRKSLKQGIIEKSNAVSMFSADSKRMALISLGLITALVFTNVVFFYNNRKQELSLEKRLAVQDRQFELVGSLLDNTTTSMHIVDNDGRILYVNKAFLDFIGLPSEEVHQKTFKELESPRLLKFEKPELRYDNLPPFESQETVEVEGQEYHFFTRKFDVKNAVGVVIASALISRDITEGVQNERGLEISREEAENARLTQEQFMANISHEIRTPMNGIIGMADLLSETALLPEQQDYLATIKQSSTSLMSLINDILDFSKIEAGMLQLEHIPFKVSEVIEQSFDLLKLKANQKKIYLNCNIDHKVPAALLGDPLRLYQIMCNLLSNAIKFTAEGGISVTVSAEAFKAPEVTLLIKVYDTGIGIPQDRINYIFQSFAQTSLDISRKFGGTGLGLTIVKQLVELQGGSISVESEEGTGSCFSIDLPYETSLPESWSANESVKFSLLEGQEVLVVEDNLINQKVISSTLKNAGIIATVVDDGFSALSILKDRKFHMIIMDIQMPEIDGRETTMKIRKDLKLNVPVIAMTASVSADERDRCISAGMNEYISKPFIKENLFEKLLLFVEI